MELEQPLDGQRRVVASVEDRELGFAVVLVDSLAGGFLVEGRRFTSEGSSLVKVVPWVVVSTSGQSPPSAHDA